MRTLFLDCQMGAAGDMLTAALLELLPDPDGFVETMNTLGIPGVYVEKEMTEKCGIRGTHIRVSVHGEEEESRDVPAHGHNHVHTHEGEHTHEHVHTHEGEHTHEHAHTQEGEHTHDHVHTQEGDHTHDHAHAHLHTSLHDIEHLIRDHFDLPEPVKEDVLQVYGLIAEAESNAHGIPVSEIHFHEVGTMDAVADVVAVCLLMHEINADEVVASPVHVGRGMVRCAHGILPVPAPATAYILKEVPIYGGSIKGELCTPTGAALLKHFVTRFGKMPAMSVQKIGYGMGTKDFPAANCVRVMLGERTEDPKRMSAGTGERAEDSQRLRAIPGENAEDCLEHVDKTEASVTGMNGLQKKAGTGKQSETVSEASAGTDEVLELSCNLDDMTAEAIGFAMEQLLEGGALDVYTIPIGMKKMRPGTMLNVLCRPEDKETMVMLLFRFTTTIGIRMQTMQRCILSRRTETMNGPGGVEQRKNAEDSGAVFQNTSEECGTAQQKNSEDRSMVRRKISEGYGVCRVKPEYEDLARIAREQGIDLDTARRMFL